MNSSVCTSFSTVVRNASPGFIFSTSIIIIPGWLGAISYSVMVGLLLKLFASAIQQKVIGEHLSHYMRVRQLVGINSTVIRAMRLVVGENGLSFPKVALLVGGPDWPVST
jgi:hypothetical protein